MDTDIFQLPNPPTMLDPPTTIDFERVLESANAGFYNHHRPPAGDVYLSESWLNLLGLRRDQVPPPDQFRTWLLEQVHPEDRRALSAAYDSLLSGKQNSYAIEVRVRHDAGHWMWVQGVVRTVEVDDRGRVSRTVGIMQDISTRKRREEHRDLLVAELHHRAKNLLALIQGVAIQTFKKTDDPRQALADFNVRLDAIAAAQALLTSSPTDGIDLAQIAAEIADRMPAQIQHEGPSLLLPASIGVTMAMALNELYTNALKYGALSTDRGRVELFWQVSTEQHSTLRIEWRETGGPAVQEPTRRGFGLQMIERSLSHELNGSVNLDFQPKGLLCLISGPVPEAS